MSDDRNRPGQRIVPRYPGTGGDATPEDVEGHRLDEPPEGSGPVQRAPRVDDGEGGIRRSLRGEDDVEGHRGRANAPEDEGAEGAVRRSVSDEDDVEGHRVRGPEEGDGAIRLPSGGGELIARVPPDSPHREG